MPRHLLLRRGDRLTRVNLAVSLVELQLVLRLNTRAHSTVGNVGNAIGNHRGLVDERDVGHHSRDPAKTVQILRKKHARNDAVIALRILDLQRILQHEARRGHSQSEAQRNLHHRA